jgi:ribose transport system substrate-binding protein
MRIAVVPKCTTHSFWMNVHGGALQAQAELRAAGIPVEIVWKGTLQEDNRTAQIDILENFIGQRVAGIVLAPLDSAALVPPVKMATAAGIPTIVIDSGLDYPGIVSYIATGNLEAGRQAGRGLGELLGGKGKVIMLRNMVGSASTEEREQGFLEVMQAYPDIELLSINQYGGANRDTAYTAAQSLMSRFGSQVDGVFTCNESTTNGMLLALREIGRAGTVSFIGFDAGEQNLEGLRKGEIHGLVIQDPFRMGYLGVMMMHAHLSGEEVAPLIDTGIRLVTPADLADPEIWRHLNPLLD